MNAAVETLATPLSALAPCEACGSAELRRFGPEFATPVNNARVFRDRAEALAVPVGGVALALCAGCGFVQNVEYDPALVAYDAGYEEQQSFSPRFVAFADALAEDLVRRWDLRGKRIVEIGCGKGDFLAKLCELGRNVGVGIDPTAAAQRLSGPGASRVTFRSELYPRSAPPLEADALVCRHTLEHIPDVRAFLAAVRRSLAGSTRTRLFFEVPDALRVLREGAFWDVYYEHCSYFTPGSLARLFRREGFVVDDVRLGFDDQYVLLEARLDRGGPARPAIAGEDDFAAVEAAASAYELTVERAVARWRNEIAARTARGERVALWGSGSKCVSFLSVAGVAADIDAVVDVNPYRQGRHLPGSGTLVEAPSVLAERRPDLVVVMNPVYVEEISASLAAMRVDAHVEAL